MNRNEEIRHECLLQLYASRSVPLSAAHIRKVARGEQFDFNEHEILNELQFLIDQKLAEIVPNIGTGEIRYRLNGNGVLHWENVESK